MFYAAIPAREKNPIMWDYLERALKRQYPDCIIFSCSLKYNLPRRRWEYIMSAISQEETNGLA